MTYQVRRNRPAENAPRGSSAGYDVRRIDALPGERFRVQAVDNHGRQVQLVMPFREGTHPTIDATVLAALATVPKRPAQL